MDTEEHRLQHQVLDPIANRGDRLHGWLITTSTRNRMMTVGDQPHLLMIPTVDFRTRNPSL